MKIKLSQKEIKRLRLTKNEQAVLSAVSHLPQRIVDIENKSKVPHSTLFDILKSLKGRGLVQVSLVDNKKLWSLGELNSEQGLGISLGTAKPTKDIEVIAGKEKIISYISNIFKFNVGKRVLVYHGREVFDGWYKILSESEIVEFNKTLVKLNIIVERFVPEYAFKKYITKTSKAYKESMLNRPQITYLLPDVYFTSKSEIMLCEDRVIIYETHLVQLLVLKDIETVKLYKSIFEILRSVGKKIDSQKEFSLYI